MPLPRNSISPTVLHTADTTRPASDRPIKSALKPPAPPPYVVEVSNRKTQQRINALRTCVPGIGSKELLQPRESNAFKDVRKSWEAEKAKRVRRAMPLNFSAKPASCFTYEGCRTSDYYTEKAATYLAYRKKKLDGDFFEGGRSASNPLERSTKRVERSDPQKAIQIFWKDAVRNLESAMDTRKINISCRPLDSFLDLAKDTPEVFFSKMQQLQQECWQAVDWKNQQDLNDFNNIVITAGDFLLKKAIYEDCWPAALKILLGASLAKKAGTFFQDDLLGPDGFSLLHSKEFWAKASPDWVSLILAPSLFDVNRIRISDEMIAGDEDTSSGPSPLYAACHSSPDASAVEKLLDAGADPLFSQSRRAIEGLDADAVLAVRNPVYQPAYAIDHRSTSREDAVTADKIRETLQSQSANKTPFVSAPWRTDWSGVRAASNARIKTKKHKSATETTQNTTQQKRPAVKPFAFPFRF